MPSSRVPRQSRGRPRPVPSNVVIPEVCLQHLKEECSRKRRELARLKGDIAYMERRIQKLEMGKKPKK